MSTITPQELLKQWKLEQIPVEMAMGHVLQNLVQQQILVDSLTLALNKLRLQLDNATSPARSLLVTKDEQKTR